ncbi:MAG: hypothetical protein ACKV0T_10470, partial [Planctomycetales bacterium]
MTLPPLLQRSSQADLQFHQHDRQTIQRAVRVWGAGKPKSNSRDEREELLRKAFQDPEAAARVVTRLEESERQMLSIFELYGPAVSGGLLRAELVSRAINTSRKKKSTDNDAGPLEDVAAQLREKMVLFLGDGYLHDAYFNRYQFNFRMLPIAERNYPEMVLHPALVGRVSAAEPLGWTPTNILDQPVKSVARRTSAEVALDLQTVCGALRQMSNWSICRGEVMAKPQRARLAKLAGLASSGTDPFQPPDVAGLYFELLKRMRCVDVHNHALLETELGMQTQCLAAVQAQNWVRAWIVSPMWQDGLGVVAERTGEYHYDQLGSQSIRHLRELLAWALCRVAHSPDQWLDLLTFLRDFHDRGLVHKFYCCRGQFHWTPPFVAPVDKAGSAPHPESTWFNWLRLGGTWAANALMVTLVTLGLVERGMTPESKPRHCFRLTPLGRAVFGAPDVELSELHADHRFLTVQPNHEIQVYLEEADA